MFVFLKHVFVFQTYQRGIACVPGGCCRTGTGSHKPRKCMALKEGGRAEQQITRLANGGRRTGDGVAKSQRAPWPKLARSLPLSAGSLS